MHLLHRDGAPCVPEPLGHDADGARRLAALCRLGPGTTVRAVLNTALDGAVAGADGTSGSLRNPDDAFVFGVLRALADVVLVGARTVRMEDYRRPLGRGDLRTPSLRPGGADHPELAVLSASGELPDGVDPAWPTLLVVPSAREGSARRTSGLPADQVIAADSPREVVDALVARGHRGIQLEGGPSAMGRFAAADVIDELCLSTSHRTVGGPSPRLIDGPAHDRAWELRSLLVGAHAHCARYVRADDPSCAVGEPGSSAQREA